MTEMFVYHPPLEPITNDGISRDGTYHLFEACGDFYYLVDDTDMSVMMGDGDSGEGEGFPTGKYWIWHKGAWDESDPDPQNDDPMTLEQVNEWFYPKNPNP